MKRTNASQSARLRPTGVIRSRLKQRRKAPKQGSEGAPDVWLDVRPFAAKALSGLAVADEIIILTWQILRLRKLRTRLISGTDRVLRGTALEQFIWSGFACPVLPFPFRGTCTCLTLSDPSSRASTKTSSSYQFYGIGDEFQVAVPASFDR